MEWWSRHRGVHVAAQISRNETSGKCLTCPGENSTVISIFRPVARSVSGTCFMHLSVINSSPFVSGSLAVGREVLKLTSRSKTTCFDAKFEVFMVFCVITGLNPQHVLIFLGIRQVLPFTLGICWVGFVYVLCYMWVSFRLNFQWNLLQVTSLFASCVWYHVNISTKVGLKYIF